MGFNAKHNNAGGRDPDFGAIFISNSGTKRECFRLGLFGLPSSDIQFVEKVKTGSILFLYDYEKRILHGVFKATCDGGINIVPKAFASFGKQYPAQVKFIPVWECKPLNEKIFREAIRENYFSANKFNFGLSEDQVYKLLDLFSMNKLEQEVPRARRHMSRTDDMISEQYPIGKVGRSAGHGMFDESVYNDQVLGDNNSPVLIHNYQGDSAQYDGFIADDILANKQRRSSELGVGYTSGYISDRLQFKDESRFATCDNEHCIDNYAAKLTLDTAWGYDRDDLEIKDESRFISHENKDYMVANFRPYTIGGYSKIPSDKISAHEDGRSSIIDRLADEELRKTDQRMIFSDDILSLRDSNVDLPVFYSKTNLEQNSLIGNHLRSTSAMIHPFEGQTLNTSCATHGDERYNLYNDAPGLSFRKSSCVGTNNGSESMIESLYPSTNYLRNSLSRESQLVHTELEDNHRWHSIGGGFSNSAFYGSNSDCMPLNEARNSDQLASKSALYEAQNTIASLKSSPAPFHSSDIENSDRVPDPFSSLFHDHKSYLHNHVHPTTSQNYLSRKLTLQNNNETLSHDVPLANEDHCDVRYDDSMDQGYDIGCYVDSQYSNHGHKSRKRSVFSRLSFLHDVNKQENGNNAPNVKYDFHTSVDEVMEMVRQSRNHGMIKRKSNPNQRSKIESLRDRTQISSHRKKRDCFEDSLEHNKDEGLRNTTQISSHRKKQDCFENALEHNKEESLKSKLQISSPKMKRGCLESALEDRKDESLKNKTQISSPKKKRDPFENAFEHMDENLKNKTLISSMRKKRNHVEDSSEDLNMDSTNVTGGNTTAKELCFVDFKRRSKVRKQSDEIERSSNESKMCENLVAVQQKRRKLIRPNFNKSTSFDEKDLGASPNLQLPLPKESPNLKGVIGSCCTLVNQSAYEVKTDAEVQNIIDPTHSEGKNSSHAREFICCEGGKKANIGTLSALNDGSECLGNKLHQKVLSAASCNEESLDAKEGSCMVDTVKEASLRTEPFNAICQKKVKVFPALNDGSECVDYKNHPKFLSSASCIEDSSHTKEGSYMLDNVKATSLRTESLHANCQEKANVDTLLALNDVTKCVDAKSHHKVLLASCNEDSSHTKEDPCMMDNVKAGSVKMESLLATRQNKANLGTRHPLNEGSDCVDNKNHQKSLSSNSCNEDSSHTKEGSYMMEFVKATSRKAKLLHAFRQEKAGNGTLPSLNDGSESADNKDHPKVLSAASCNEDSFHTKECSCVMDNKKSASPRHNADKIICADRGINANDKMPEDCVSFSIEAKDGSEYLGNTGNEKAPTETCHIKACI